MSRLEEVNPDDNSLNDLLQSNSMDQVSEQRVDQPADSREELGIDQGQGSQAPAPTRLLTSQHLGQTLATTTGDSDSQRNIGKNGEEERRVRKRKTDRAYRQRKKNKKKELEDENDQLKQEKDEQKQQINSLLEENEKLKWKLDENERQCKYFLDRIADAIKQSMSTTYLQQLLDGVKLDISSLSQKVDGLQQNITQLSGTQVYAHPWQPQLISQDSQAAATTLPLTQPFFQSLGMFTENSHGLSDFWQPQQSGQIAHPIDVLPEFSSAQEQGGNSAFVPPELTDGLLYPYRFPRGETFFQDFADDPLIVTGFQPENRKREKALGPNHARSTKQTILDEFEAEHTILKRKIEGKDQLIKSYLQHFATLIERLMGEIEKKEQIMKNNRKAFEAENGRLKYGIEEKETLMKSNMEAFDVRNGKMKIEIGEKKQPMKSNMKSFEAENGGLKREIQTEEQLMKSDLQTLEAQIGQLVNEFKSLDVDIVALNRRMQTHQGN